MNEPIYLCLSILDLSETVMKELWYDYVKPKYGKNGKFFYMDRALLYSFVAHVKIEEFIKILQKMLKQGLIFQILNKKTDHCLKEKIKR